MKLPSRATSFLIGLAAIALVVALQTFNSVVCYRHDLATWGLSLCFVAVPMLPAVLALAGPQPLRAVGASLLFAPWLVYAYYIDCIKPYTGGGASMIYVAVVLYGLPSAIVGTLLTGPLLRWLAKRAS
ncbi:hypothetical protein [Chitinimonas taiwanensis]|uniref:Uncharacterized protein n=1 Tax=Chitinimonas taiwanensis DSM 18899 TaxID=1121279 RepID=A0A1K2HMZ1_9NEIS|nr:hypothetical protein [Chitinimonas taiwanensis]SFZ78172.1 hypothetical protein SAMN02745887_02832 [Chitinimonas taiwanensis DSM 18899]